MFELLSICSGVALGTGAALLRRSAGRVGTIVAIALLAVVTTVASGEAARSWAYFAVDFVQAGAAFGVGFITVAWLGRRATRLL
ncbi:MAG TPA: hypothetical protein VHR97_01605 [Candidatus Baltobacteraceae bacterium]|jgi:hypothetical protein|nr:hypothetical protein [Candidatus Baltobacteraceae bacterium]